jgi:hypothetical protein
MSWLITLLRRTVWLIVLAALGGAVYSWWRARTEPPASAPPEWPPLASSAPTARAGAAGVGALVDTPDVRPSDNGDTTWVTPDGDGSCPITHPVKANDNSGIFHVPGGRFYDRTGAERCYTSAEAALADGYRQAKA